MTYWALTTCSIVSGWHRPPEMAGRSRSLMRPTTQSAVDRHSLDSVASGAHSTYVHMHQWTGTPAERHVRPTGITSNRLTPVDCVRLRPLSVAAAVLSAAFTYTNKFLVSQREKVVTKVTRFYSGCYQDLTKADMLQADSPQVQTARSPVKVQGHMRKRELNIVMGDAPNILCTRGVSPTVSDHVTDGRYGVRPSVCPVDRQLTQLVC